MSSVNLELLLARTLKDAHLWRGELRSYQRLVETTRREIEAISETDLRRLEMVAASKDVWLVAYCAMVIAATTGIRGCELKRMRVKDVNQEARKITITPKATKTDAGARSVELNTIALGAIQRLVERAEKLGSPPHDYLLPADLSRHTKANDPLQGKRGFDPTRHQESWRTAWRNLCKVSGFDFGFHQLRHNVHNEVG